VVLLLAASFLGLCGAISFDIVAGETKCLSEELLPEELVQGDWWLSEPPGVPHKGGFSLTVKDAEGNPVFSSPSEQMRGTFAFTTSKTGGVFSFCFALNPSEGTYVVKRVGISLKVGVQAKDYTKVALDEHLNKLETFVRKIEDQVSEVFQDIEYLKKREAKMRDTNESTNARVKWLSIFEIGTFIGLSLWQVFYLKNYLHKKKVL